MSNFRRRLLETVNNVSNDLSAYLVGLYTKDSVINNTLTDLSGKGNNAVVTGTITVVDNCFYFSTKSDYAIIDFGGLDDFTVICISPNLGGLFLTQENYSNGFFSEGRNCLSINTNSNTIGLTDQTWCSATKDAVNYFSLYSDTNSYSKTSYINVALNNLYVGKCGWKSGDAGTKISHLLVYNKKLTREQIESIVSSYE